MPIYEFDNTYSNEVNSPDFGEDGEKKKSEIKSISNATQALQIARKLEWNDRDRDIRRARVLSAFNGAAPYCDSDLVNKAQSYRYNVSFGFLEGVVGRAVAPFNDLTLNIADLTEIEANLSDDKLKIIQAEFGKIMKKWGKWSKYVSRVNQDLVLNGYNSTIFPSDYDPFPIFVEQAKGYVDEGSQNDVNELELYVWKKSYLIHELYARIEDESVAKKAGWDVDNVKKALMQAAPSDIFTGGGSSSGQWTEIEKAIRGGSLWASIVGAKVVNTYHVFAAELSGKVTHWIVLDDTKVKDDGSFRVDFEGSKLFKKEDRFDAMREFLVFFDLEPGDGTWHGSKGVGQRAFNTHKAIDKLRCSLLDQAFVSGLTILQPSDQVSQEELTLSVVGPFAVIPNGIGVQPATLPAVSGTTFQADMLLTQTSEQRIGDVVPSGPMAPVASETATAARIAAGRQELITRGNLKRYIDPISQVMSIIVRRLLKSNSPNPFAKEFQKELKRKGLTDEDIKEIKGARNTGRIEDILGNTAANTQVIFAEFRGDPDIDQIDLKQRRIASVLDADAADALIITDQDQTKQIESKRLQELELTSILSGLKIPVSPRDNHEIHLAVLFEWIGTEVQKQAQNFNPDSIPVIKTVMVHAKEHLDYLKRDKLKKSAYESLNDRYELSEDAVKDLEKMQVDLAQAQFDAARKIAKTPEEFAAVEQAEAQLNQTQTSE